MVISLGQRTKGQIFVIFHVVPFVFNFYWTDGKYPVDIITFLPTTVRCSSSDGPPGSSPVWRSLWWGGRWARRRSASLCPAETYTHTHKCPKEQTHRSTHCIEHEIHDQWETHRSEKCHIVVVAAQITWWNTKCLCTQQSDCSSDLRCQQLSL